MNTLSEYGRHVAISVTNACPIRCGHCVSGSSPEASKGADDLPRRFAAYLDENPDVRLVSLTGGEPFLHMTRLRDFIRICILRGVNPGAVTSGYWAKTPSAAARTLAEADGLKSMTISTDAYHQDFVPLRFIENAYRAAKQAGIHVRIRLTRDRANIDLGRAMEAQVLQFCSDTDLERASLAPYGRAEELPEAWGVSPDAGSIQQYGSCPSSGPHIFEDGRVTPCCNSIVSLKSEHALSFGNIRQESATAIVARIRRSELFLTIKMFGFDYILDKLVAHDIRYRDFQARNACDFCYRICTDTKLGDDVAAVLQAPDHAWFLHIVALTEYGNDESEAVISALAQRRLQATEDTETA